MAENFEIKKQLDLVTAERDMMAERLKIKEAIDAKMGDPSPVDGQERRTYVARVAGLYKDILEPKYRQMISTAHALLEESSNNREFDQALKGGIYMLWEMIRWGDSMVNEQVANQNNALSEEENNNKN